VRSDVYCLGATLYHLLTGRAPCEAEPVGEVYRRILAGEITLPRSLNPQVAQGLEAICLKALALKPEDRYESAAALKADLERWLADEPVTAHREGWQSRMARWTRRHRTLVAGLLVLLVTSAAALAAVLVLVDLERQKTVDERNLAIQERNTADRERLKAKAAQADADRESARAERERATAEAAKVEAYRNALASYHQAADSSLSSAHLLRYAVNQPDPQRQALAEVHAAARLRLLANDALQSSGQVAGDAGREEQRRWEDRAEVMRSEAEHWLNDFEIRGVREIVVPSTEEESWPDAPALAVRDDGRRIALAKDRQNVIDIIILDEEATLRHRITLAAPPQVGVLYPNLGSPALLMIQDCQVARRTSFSRGFPATWTPQRADFIEIAGDPEFGTRVSTYTSSGGH
jgi:hypothetical protein